MRQKKIITVLKKSYSVYDRINRFLSPFMFVFGFISDFMASRRIDAMTENYKLLAYVAGAGLGIALYHLSNNNRIRLPNFIVKNNILKFLVDFLLGGLFSSHVIFYFKSSAGVKSAIFIAILFLLLILNQFFKKQTSRLYLQFGMFSLASFSFFIFFIPVYTREMHHQNFFLAGGISLAYSLLILLIVILSRPKKEEKPFFRLSGMIIGLHGIIAAFYFFNWIPPVPMALKHAGIYHQVVKTDSYYQLTYEKPSGWNVWKTHDGIYHYRPGDTVFCFAAIFAPTAMKKTIYHRWHYYDPSSDTWQKTDQMRYDLTGGRDGGYRGYTYKTSIREGLWRVDIITEEERLIGTVHFELKADPSDQPRKLKTILR